MGELMSSVWKAHMFDVWKTWKRGAGLAFSKPRYLALAAGLFIFFIPLYLLLTNVVLIDTLSLNPNLTPVDGWSAILLAGLAALGFTLAAFQWRELSGLSHASAGSVGIGGFLGTLATACQICQPIWLFWLGLGSATAFVAEWSPYILPLSILLLLFSIHLGLGAIASGCPVRRPKAGKTSAEKKRPEGGHTLKPGRARIDKTG